MNAATKEWINRAEEDFRVAKRESKVLEEPSYSAVCFHSQQSAEKYLKAFLQENGIIFPKTHDLVYLLELPLPIKPLWSVYKTSLENLNAYAVDVRYPGDEVIKEEAVNGFAIASEIKNLITEELGRR